MFLHRWQVEELITALGPHASGFHLDEWVHNLEKRQTSVVLPAQRWAWVLHQLELEVKARGLPTGDVREHWTARCQHTPRCQNATNCQTLSICEAARKAKE